jgi:hypothetical protein
MLSAVGSCFPLVGKSCKFYTTFLSLTNPALLGILAVRHQQQAI